MSAAQSEHRFIQRLQAGDNAAFAELISRYHTRFIIVARAIVGDTFAEDVVQEAWSSIYRAIGKFEGRSALSTWMIQIVSNEAKSRLRREKRHTALDDIEPLLISHDDARFDASGHWQVPPSHWEFDTPELMLQKSDLQRCLEHCLDSLPENQKAVFVLRELEQQELDDIASTLQLAAGNIRVLLHRARLRLMETINHYQETGEC